MTLRLSFDFPAPVGVKNFRVPFLSALCGLCALLYFHACGDRANSNKGDEQSERAEELAETRVRFT